MKAWHFLRADRRLAYPPRTPVLIGQKIAVDPDKLELCKYGLHASIRALDALGYAPGPIICRVELGGRILTSSDKVCASERTVIAMVDATDTLRAFARSCALDVIDKWDAPSVVREYLETGNEELRESAESAAAWSVELAAAAAWSAESAAWTAELAVQSARSAAWSARSAQNNRLEAMLLAILGEKECS